MATANLLRSPLLRLFLAVLLFSLSYFLGIHSSTSSRSSAPLILNQQQHHPLHCAPKLNLSSPSLDFQPHHFVSLPREPLEALPSLFDFCPPNFTDYCPCHDPSREKLFTRPPETRSFFHRERHCPPPDEKPKCLVPKPRGYRKPFAWPKSRDHAWFKNVPFKKLTVTKKTQNWVRLEGNLLVFPGGGTSFPKGVKGYVEEIKRVLPLKSGSIRTALDIGCGVSGGT